jgi:hypothetical protein
VNFIEHRRDLDLGITEPKPLDFASAKISFVADLKKVGGSVEVLLRVFFLPAAPFNQALDKEILAGGEIDHAAVVVRDECDVGDPADGDRVRDLELTVAEVGAAGSQNVREIVRDMQKFAAVHAHADEKLGLGIRFEGAVQVLVLEETSDRGVPVFRRDVRDLVDWNETVHVLVGSSLNGNVAFCPRNRNIVSEIDKVYLSLTDMSIKSAVRLLPPVILNRFMKNSAKPSRRVIPAFFSLGNRERADNEMYFCVQKR